MPTDISEHSLMIYRMVFTVKPEMVQKLNPLLATSGFKVGWLEVIFEIWLSVVQLALTLCSENIKFVRFSEK